MGSFFKTLVVIRIDGRLSIIKPWKAVNFSRRTRTRVDGSSVELLITRLKL